MVVVAAAVNGGFLDGEGWYICRLSIFWHVRLYIFCILNLHFPGLNLTRGA